MDILLFLPWLLYKIYPLVYVPLGIIVGSFFDYGKRSDGNVRGDLPSSLGALIGLGMAVYTILL